MRIWITGLVAAILPLFGSFASAAEDEGKQEDLGDEVIAVVLGKEIKASQKNELSQLIIGPLMDDFVEKNKIEPNKEQIESFLAHIQEANAEVDEDLAAEDPAVMKEVQRQMAHSFVKAWLIHKALHQKYGGRVAFQQIGMEPVDAYRKFLKEREEAGDFRILDEQAKAEFWQYFTDDQRHRYLDDDDSANSFKIPYWEMAEAEED